MTFFIACGTDRYCLKEVALAFKEAGEDQQHPQAENLKADIGRKTFGVCSVLTINTLLVATGLFFYLQHCLQKEFTLPLFWICVLIVFGRAALQVSSCVTRGLGKVLLSEAIFSLVRPLIFVIPMAFCFFGSIRLSLASVLLMFAGSYLAVTVVFLIVNSKVPALKPKYDPKKVANVYRCSFFFFLIGFGLSLIHI